MIVISKNVKSQSSSVLAGKIFKISAMSIQCINHDHAYHPISDSNNQSTTLDPRSSLTVHTKSISNLDLNIDTAVLVTQENVDRNKTYEFSDHNKAATSVLLLQKIHNSSKGNHHQRYSLISFLL